MQNRTVPADRKLMRHMNQSSLLNLVRAQAPISRPQLAQLSGLSLATVIGITNELIEHNLVLESGIAESTGGRKASLLEIRHDGGFAIGLKLTEYETTGVVLNLNGDIVYSEQQKVLLSNNSQYATELLATMVQDLIKHSEIAQQKIIGVGCGLSGYVDVGRGRSIDSPILGWQDVEISTPLQARLNIPVFLDNDVNCLTIYEMLFGQGRPYNHFLTVAIGRGVGLGIVIHGDLYRGASGGAGEFGHTPIIAEGRLCECGKRGCLEAYVCESGIVQNYLEHLHTSTYQLDLYHLDRRKQATDMTAMEVLEKARHGDEAALVAFRRAGTLLGMGLANLVNLLNPEGILLTSYDSILGAGDLFFGPMKVAMQQYTFSRLAAHMQFIVEPLGYENWARGAGSLALRQLFLLPTKA